MLRTNMAARNTKRALAVIAVAFVILIISITHARTPQDKGEAQPRMEELRARAGLANR